jgi:hypothetical protein
MSVFEAHQNRNPPDGPERRRHYAHVVAAILPATSNAPNGCREPSLRNLFMWHRSPTSFGEFKLSETDATSYWTLVPYASAGNGLIPESALKDVARPTAQTEDQATPPQEPPVMAAK